MKLLAAVLAVTVLVVTCEAGSKCVWGPSYWCQNAATAEECGEHTYCQDNVWKTEAEVGDGLECGMCELLMKEVDKFIANNNTEMEVEVEIEKFCTVLGPLADDCKSLIEDNFDVIWKLLENETDPVKVCTEIGVCTNSAMSVQHEKVVKGDPAECTLCNMVIHYLEEFVDKNGSEAKVEHAIENICKILPGAASTECTEFVEKNFDSIWQLFKNDSKEICKVVFNCSKTGFFPRQAPSLVKVGDACSTCKLIVSFLAHYVDSNSTEQEVKNALESLCKLLPSSLNCSSFIDKYFDVIWALVKGEFDNDEICKQLSICTSASSEYQITMPMQALNSCDTCLKVSGLIKPYLNNMTTEEAAKKWALTWCKLLPGHYLQLLCTEEISEAFESDIWPNLEFLFDYNLTCVILGACNHSLSIPNKVPRVYDPCHTCHQVAQLLDPFIHENSTKEGVRNWSLTFCSQLPGTSHIACTDAIGEYFDVIWDYLIVNLFDSGDVCVILGSCSTKVHSTPAPVKMQVKVPIVRADSCSLCKLVASYLQHFVDGSNSEEEVKSYVEALCKLLPGNTSTECTQLVDKYFDSIWEELKTELDSGKVCQDIGLCNSTLAQPPVKALVKAPTAPADLCSTCKLVASFLKHFVDSNSSEAEVKGALEAFCKLLPGNVSTECKDLVDKSFDTIWILLKAEVDSGKICEQIGLCNSTLSRPVSKAPLQSSDEECEICKMVMLYLDEVVDKNSTEGEVKDALEKVCSLIQSNECKTVIDKYFDMIWQMVKTEADSGKVCEMIGVCKDSTFRRQPVKAPVGGVSCSLCDLAVKFLKPFVDSNITETEAKDSLEKLCGYLKPALLEDECTQLIDDDFPMIWKLLQSYVDDAQICKEIGLCSSFVATIQSKAPDASVECVLCEFVMKEVDNLIGNNKTTAAVEAALKKVCDVLPATIKDLCDSFVDKYAPTIIQLIEEELTPDQICTKLGLCNSTVSVRILVTTPKASVECILCEFVLKEVDSIIGTNESEAVVKAAVEKVCSILPTTIETECKKLVDEYADQIIDMIMNGLNPDEVCSAIGLCKSTTRVKVTSPKASVQCILCEFVMKEVDTILNGSTTEAAVEAALEKVCDVLPTTIKAECDALVKQYTPEIVKLIINGLSPSEVCTMLGLCKSTTSVGVASPMISVECVMCEFVMKEVDSMLMKNSTEKDIEGVLEKICNYLPATVQKDCVSFIDLYTPKLLDALVKELDPKDVCTALNLCSNSSLTVAPKSPKAGPLCVVCEFVLEKLAGLVNKTSTKTEIKAALDEVCSLLPKTIESECVDFVNKSADEIVELLFDGVAPKVVCSLLHLCLLSDQSRPTAVNTPKLDECAVCKFTIQSIKTLIDSKAAQSTVEEALEKACGLLPKEISGECESLVEKYDPQIIQLLDQEIKPEAFCEDVKLCKKTRKATNVLMQPWLKMARIREL